MSRNNIEDVYVLAPSQSGILFHHLYAQASGLFVVQIACTWHELDIPTFERAWLKVIERHPVLRTAFVWENLDTPLQVVGRQAKLPLEEQDWRAMSEEEQERQFEEFLSADRLRGFRLNKAPLMRATLLRLSDSAHRLVWSHHHMLLDGWSIFMVLKELFAFYEALSQGEELQLEKPRPFRDYIAWVQQQEPLKAESFWREMLAGLTTPTLFDDPRAPARSDAPPPAELHDELHMFLSTETTSALQTVARQHKITLNTMVLGVWALLLSHYTGQRDVVFGSTVSGRQADLSGIDKMVGLFINVLPMRIQVAPGEALAAWLKKIQKQQVAMRQYEHTPLFQAQRWSDIPRRQPMFDSILSFENYPIDNSLPAQSRSLRISDVTNLINRNNYPLTVMAKPGEELSLRLVYDRTRFNAATIKQMLEHFAALLQACSLQPEAELRTLLDMTSRVEKRRRVTEQKKQSVSGLEEFRKIKPREVSVPRNQLVSTGYLSAEQTLPLVFQPATDEIDLTGWAEHNKPQIEAELLKHGALLFRGFKIDQIHKFERFAASVSTELFGEYGDLPREEIDSKVYGATPYPSDKPILFHNESSHLQSWPLRIWFYCVKAATQGGETPIVDCRQLYHALDPAIRERLTKKKLRYVRNFVAGLDVSWQAFFRTSDRAVVESQCRRDGIDFKWKGHDGLRTSQIRPAIMEHPRTGETVFFNQLQLHHIASTEPGIRSSLQSVFGEEDLPRNVYYGDGSTIEDSVVEAIAEAYRKMAKSFLWQPGDILMLDNMLAAHSRNPYIGERKIVVAMGDMVHAARQD